MLASLNFRRRGGWVRVWFLLALAWSAFSLSQIPAPWKADRLHSRAALVFADEDLGSVREQMRAIARENCEPTTVLINSHIIEDPPAKPEILREPFANHMAESKYESDLSLWKESLFKVGILYRPTDWPRVRRGEIPKHRVTTQCAPSGIFYRQWGNAILTIIGPPLALLAGVWLLLVLGRRTVNWTLVGFHRDSQIGPNPEDEHAAAVPDNVPNIAVPISKQVELTEVPEFKEQNTSTDDEVYHLLGQDDGDETAIQASQEILKTLKNRLSWSVVLAAGLDVTLRAMASGGQSSGTNILLFALMAIGLYYFAKAKAARTDPGKTLSGQAYVATFWLIAVVAMMLSAGRYGGV